MNREERRARAKEAERKGFVYMGIIKGFTKAIADPTTPEKSVTIKMLSYFDLEAARLAGMDKMRDKVKLLGEFRAALPERPRPTEEAAGAAPAAAAKGEPLSGYDVETLLRLGVVSWTFDAELDIKLFDEVTALHVATQILEYAKPPEAELGKASSSSTAT